MDEKLKNGIEEGIPTGPPSLGLRGFKFGGGRGSVSWPFELTLSGELHKEGLWHQLKLSGVLGMLRDVLVSRGNLDSQLRLSG